MAIDRAATLKIAEKLLRQGKIEPAIAEYLRVVEDQPRDLNSANTLGDLYVRAGQIDKAVEQFTRIADSVSEEGFLPKASAIYKKILKLRPDNEHALLQAAKIASSLGLNADARAYLTQIIERRRGRGDTRGAALARIRLGSLDPSGFASRRGAASGWVEINDVPGAVRDLKEIAAELVEKGRAADAIEVLREVAVLAPDDGEIRQRLLDVYVACGDFARARECASTPDQLKRLAVALEAGGHEDTALEVLGEAARLDPEDGALRVRLARAFVGRGNLQAAAEYLTVEMAGDDPQLLFAVAEIRLRGDTPDEGLAIVRRLLERYPDRREEVALLGWTVGERVPETGFGIVDLAAAVAVANQDWASAAAALQEFVTRVPNHIPALMRLIEICVDGGLEATMSSAQAHLADAYIAGGLAAEARCIAEDLVAREPWDRANLERFRRALELLGEPDPETLIAERLNGQSPFFMTTDLFLESDEFPSGLDEPPQAADSPAPPSPAPPSLAPLRALGTEAESRAPVDRTPPRDGRAKPGSKPGHDPFELGANAIDLDSILAELESPSARAPGAAAVLRTPAVAHASSESVEVDLSIVLKDIKRPSKRPDLPAAAPATPGSDIDNFFARLRDDARSAMDEAEQQYRRGLLLREAGDIDGCITAFQSASRAPSLRFATASMLARIFRDRGMRPQAVEWFERAAQAPAPTAAEGHDLLYDLADELEKEGEVARALAISLELQADAGAFRDVAERIERLTKVQARG